MKVVIVGGGVMGSSLAYHLLSDPAFEGKVTVVERDIAFASASSALSLAGVRQQFSQPINIRLSLDSIGFLREAGERLKTGETPAFIALHERGYLILAREQTVDELRAACALQAAEGSDIVMLRPEDLRARYPWLASDGIAGASWGRSGEGWFDGYALFSAFWQKARSLGAQRVEGQVSGFRLAGDRVTAVELADGTLLACDVVVNAAGPWSGELAARAGIDLPVRPRRRSVFLFACRSELPDCPVVFDPRGVSFRPEGPNFVCTAPPRAADDTDGLPLEPDYDQFENHIWPILAERVPAFEEIRLLRGWAGYYEMNLFDQNAFIGPHDRVRNLHFLTGFSGHGIQQSPAVGRGLAELIVHGAYRTMDLSELSYSRLAQGRPLLERNIFG